MNNIDPSNRSLPSVSTEKTTSRQGEGQGKIAQEELDQLTVQKDEYFKLFRSVMIAAEVDELNPLDFLKLDQLLGNFEAQATRAREAIRTLAEQDGNQAGSLKEKYDIELSELHRFMTDLGESVITARKEDLDQQAKELFSRTDILPSPGVILKLKSDYQQLESLIREFRGKMKRVQVQRLFEL